MGVLWSTQRFCLKSPADLRSGREARCALTKLMTSLVRGEETLDVPRHQMPKI
jgi:hypothetical protein